MTPVRHAMLSFLAATHTPVTLQMIVQADGVRGVCNATTVYRTLMLFKAADIVRFVASSRKESYFCLNVPGENNHLLICRECGRTVVLNLTRNLEDRISEEVAARGFSASKQDCEIHAVCNDCHQARRLEPLPSKMAS
jgi:Fe2+ or Zn2+ uptake regulation protein